ncbi:Copper amine oxidase 1 [Cyphellophora attinorum]|uniref:Amine oxidase n=1 Tax=Cyphellophora attinorum TaxID=1664694 RepID=A0A0N1HDM3_9EURO|nr:Copper amine oxidase 1 [Phialophora attinorum]KPI42590.1 Copper amine oxidase 1 [Phialophora attinorum]
MVLERVKQIAQQLTGTARPSHPLDPLTFTEIESAVSILRSAHGKLYYNAVTLFEPPKAEMVKWLTGPEDAAKPDRKADIVCIGTDGKIYDGVVNLKTSAIEKWEHTPDVQPLITMEDLQAVEHVCRVDPKVIEQCGIIGIPASEMHKVYADPWTIGYDERFGSGVRLQQALMYYRPHVDDSQYAFPLDFCPIYDATKGEIIHIDIPKVRRPISRAPPQNYHVPDIEKEGGYRTDLKPLHITQPEGVSFTVTGRTITWQNWSVHVGFNYREGLILNDISFYDRDEGRQRPIFYRLSLAEMVVPYGNPEHPHQRKHAFDLGEYGGGYMTNSLSLGCDCKGAIHYMDFDFVTRSGAASTIKNAICIHEEDAGILFKHTDFRDDSVVVTRARKLVISHVFTAANYEYLVYYIFHQDGTVQLEIKLTGILNTYAMLPDEDTKGWGTQVYPGVNAHNHQHLFCLRINPAIDGYETGNSIFQVDATPGAGEVGSAENFYGNAFYAKKTRFETQKDGFGDYDGNTSRSWDMSNESKLNKYSGKPVSYKLVSREVPKLLPKENSLVWKRAGFARHAVHVTKYPPRRPPRPPNIRRASQGIPLWQSANPSAALANTDVVLWHTFGLTHFPAPEDFPVMPAEPMSLLLRPRNFFLRNPALDVRPSFARTPTQVAAGKAGKGDVDGVSVQV